MNPKRILVLMGGMSEERDVSLRSGKAIWEALLALGYEAQALDFNRTAIRDIIDYKPDLVFIALHGKYGEDGTVQGLLESLQIPYTGSGVATSAICIDKVLSKRIFTSEGIPNAAYQIINRPELDQPDVIREQLLTRIGLPLVVKAATQGSSIGTYIIKDEKEIITAIEKAFQYSREVLVEAFIDGQELTVAVIGNNEPQVLPLIEITSANSFYDYESKYTKGMCEHIIPARIGEDSAAKIVSISQQVYKLMGCQGFARIDFILDKQGQPFVLEVNTIPGMTEMSLVPDAARAAGIEFNELVEIIVNMALANHS
ncbi:MAG TPA: D-alanine--D-alanine ligase [Syntrophomonas sp.]|nr:D-alanine--D-alanine ligase [Syntrophomonas sp.]HRW12489.1 D-alanine--D-alanine ligase [Syntrophomonas sp.]